MVHHIVKYFATIIILWMTSFAVVMLYTHPTLYHNTVKRNLGVSKTAAPNLEPFLGNHSQASVTEPKVPKPCKCKSKYTDLPPIFDSQFSLPVSWRNLTNKELLERTHPNLPINMYENSHTKWCQLLPAFNKIKWHNIYYQPVQVSESTLFFLYSAFLDNRVVTDVHPCIRILAYSQDVNPTAPWCHIWFNTTGPPAVSHVSRIDYLDWQPRSSERHMTFLLTCQIPKFNAHLTPLSVSVVKVPCDKRPTNLLKVIGSLERNVTTAKSSKSQNSPSLWNAAVCGPALFYYQEDVSVQLVEWLELLRALGFARVFLLETNVHPNIEKVLRHYEAEGFVGVTKFAYPGPYANDPFIRGLWVLLEHSKVLAMENLYFTDCILRHMHEYRFIARLNLDEMPMLLNYDSFPHWLNDQIQQHSTEGGSDEYLPPSYDLRWYYHHDDIRAPASSASLPKYLKILRQSKRAVVDVYPTNYNPTYDMDIVTGVFSNDVAICANGKCRSKSYQCPRDVAYLGHYTKTCGDVCENPDATVEVPALLKYKDQVSSAVEEVLKKLRLTF
ncbi:uncharacterized protein LOC122244345 [Penaeus japonicus]|uniref:uncharacterized protein LOC122244345 n=1 Tax=Penaeus japonicus TaxID=27405 RepID=UPI001C70D7BB|nr:uncharacterized protein LOC122244345 [Penaeus japonicus]